MTVPVNTYPRPAGRLGIEHLKRATDGSIEAEKTRLRKATKEFESFFIYQMLKTMRQTIPENGLGEGAPMSGGLGRETFTDLFDMEIARKTSFGGHNSIASMLYKSMEKLIDAKFEEVDPAVKMRPLTPPSNGPLPIETEDPIPLPTDDPAPLELPGRTSDLPFRTSYRPVNVEADPIRVRFGHLIDEAARENRLDSALISSVIRAESSGDPQAQSPAGAKGLMQLMDSTARELEVGDPYDPAENIKAGSRYLRRMLDRFGDLKLALAAYNAGPGNVEKYGGVPPFEETEAYVRRVTDLIASATEK